MRVVQAPSLRGMHSRRGKFCLTSSRTQNLGAAARPPGPGMTCCVAAASRCMDGFSSGSGSVKNSETLRNQEVWLPPVYNKSPAAETIITKALEANILMKELSVEDRTVTLALSNPRLRLRPPPHLTLAPAPTLASRYPTPYPHPRPRQTLMKAMNTVKFKPGQQIIKQGDEGDKFYVIGAGTCDITVKGKGSVMKASRGVAFGELALMFHQPRAATVTAEGDVVAWQVDDITFKHILMNNWKPPVNKKTKACESFLTKVLGENLLFKELAPADRQVTLALTPTPALAPAPALAVTLALALTPTSPPAPPTPSRSARC